MLGSNDFGAEASLKKTKIICTLGPAVNDRALLGKLLLAGVNAVRVNFSHGTHESHKAMLDQFKEVRDELGLSVATILDTKGPEIRIKTFRTGLAELVRGETFVLTTDEAEGDGHRVSVTYKNLHNELHPGDRILIDDGCDNLPLHIIEHLTGCVIPDEGHFAGMTAVLHRLGNIFVQMGPDFYDQAEEAYRGLVEVQPQAHHSASSVKCDALLVDTVSRSDTYPYVDVQVDDVSMAHEATVSKVSDDQLFYLMQRGMEEDEAMAMIVRGFVEPIARELPMEYALELNRLIELQMEGAVG